MKESSMLKFKHPAYYIIFILTIISAPVFSENNAHKNSSNEKQTPDFFALGLTSLKEHGFGGILRLKYSFLALEGSVGAMPAVLIFDSYRSIEFGMPLNADAGLIFFFNDQNRDFRNGLRLGGTWNRAFGGGFMLGWTGDCILSRFILSFGAGMQYYPEGVSHLKKYFDTVNTIEKSSNFQVYAGVSLLFNVF